MRKQLVLAAVLAAAAIPSVADDRRGPYRGDQRYGRDGYYGLYDRQGPRGNAVRSAMRDLEMMFRRSRVDHHEADHFRRALRELAEFERHAARGRFDRGSLDDAIGNMADLARAEQLHPRDRQVIRRHMIDLRQLRNYGDRY